MIHYYHRYIPKGRETLSELITKKHMDIFEPYLDYVHINQQEEGQPGFEMSTLKLMQSDLNNYADDELIFYAHTKGVSRPESEQVFTTHWRESMQDICLRLIQSGYKPKTAVGGFLLQSSHFKTLVPDFGDYDFFGGNFWIARVDFLKTLPEVDLTADRFFAERWIGMTHAELESPNLNDWPNYAAFYRASKLII